MSSQSVPWESLSSHGIDSTKAAYPVSDERTPMQELPFPPPKYRVRPSTGNIYETTSPIPEEYDPVTGYIDSVLSIMGRREEYEIGERLRVEDGEEEMKDGGKRGAEWWTNETGPFLWMGRVEYPESSERTSIKREAKQAREERQKRRQKDEGVQGNK